MFVIAYIDSRVDGLGIVFYDVSRTFLGAFKRCIEMLRVYGQAMYTVLPQTEIAFFIVKIL